MLVHSLASAQTCPGRVSDRNTSERYLLLWRNNGGLGIDDAETVTNLLHAQDGFRQPGCFTSRKRADRSPLQRHFTLSHVDDDQAICREGTRLHGLCDSRLQLDIAWLFCRILHLP